MTEPRVRRSGFAADLANLSAFRPVHRDPPPNPIVEQPLTMGDRIASGIILLVAVGAIITLLIVSVVVL